MASRRIAAILALALFALPAVALADPTPQEKELARGLMQKGRDARQAHDNKLALESFKAADDIMHVPTTGFELARSQADLGQLVEAHETLLRVMRIPERPDDSQGFKDARGYAKVLDDELLQRIPQIKIAIEGGNVTSVTVDGVALPAGAGLVPYRVNPGHHLIVAKGAAAEGRGEIDVAERETKSITVKLVATAAPPEPPLEPNPKPPPVAIDVTPKTPAPRTLTWIGFGVAGAGVLAGSITGIMSMSKKSDLESACNGTRCPPSANDTLSSANTLATISTVSFIVAGVGAGVGVVSLFLAKPPPPNAARVEPWIGAGAAGVRGSF